MGYSMDIIQVMHKQINAKSPFCKNFIPQKLPYIWYCAIIIQHGSVV